MDVNSTLQGYSHFLSTPNFLGDLHPKIKIAQIANFFGCKSSGIKIKFSDFELPQFLACWLWVFMYALINAPDNKALLS